MELASGVQWLIVSTIFQLNRLIQLILTIVHIPLLRLVLGHGLRSDSHGAPDPRRASIDKSIYILGRICLVDQIVLVGDFW